jgi:hypothetical protein
MDIEQKVWTAEDGWRITRSFDGDGPAALVLVFAAPGLLDDGEKWREIVAAHPGARLIGCSTGGEIAADEVLDDSVVVTALRFASSSVATAWVDQGDFSGDSRAAGAALAAKLPTDGLKSAFVLSDGTQVNGAQLALGMRETLGDGVLLTGGLAGDGAAFGRTVVGVDDAAPESGRIAAVGFYGAGLTVRHGSFGGWDRFGPERRITRSVANVLYEIDGEPALDLYKRYLGEDAAGLPGSALLFPLAVRAGDGGTELVRTIVGVDETAKTMTFAGDVPEGASAQLMRGHFDHLIQGAEVAAEQADADGIDGGRARLAILVSCIGRKLLLGQRITDEAEACADVLGPQTAQAGFYSYGELSPLTTGGSCELHNQTMTITIIAEA